MIKDSSVLPTSCKCGSDEVEIMIFEESRSGSSKVMLGLLYMNASCIADNNRFSKQYQSTF